MTTAAERRSPPAPARLGGGPDMRAAADAGAAATHQVHLALTERLYERGALRDGLDPVTAADILYALGSPHMHQLLRRQAPRCLSPGYSARIALDLRMIAW